jgi:hypothetical protein
MKSPKAPKKTQEQVSAERRQQHLLDDSIEETENQLKAVARGKLGKSSLMGSGASRRGATSKSSMLSTGAGGGGGSAGGGGGGSRMFTGGGFNKK